MFVRTVRRVVWVSAIAAMVNGSCLVSEVRNTFGPEHLRRLPLARGIFRRNRAIPVAGAPSQPDQAPCAKFQRALALWSATWPDAQRGAGIEN
jgi:hypothetical protein